jgi:transglutaminase-like putative cysteine protease
MFHSVQYIPDGSVGTGLTLEKISQIVGFSLRRPVVRLVALSVLKRANVDGRNNVEVASAIFNFVKNKVRFVPDPVNVETLQCPETTLRLGYGDCDDQALLIAALMASVGLSVRFRTVGVNSENHSHIFTEVFLNDWVSADPSECSQLGERVPLFPSEKIYNYRSGG